jgi:hypothetical protein
MPRNRRRERKAACQTRSTLPPLYSTDRAEHRKEEKNPPVKGKKPRPFRPLLPAESRTREK